MALKPITSLKSLLSEVGTPDRLILIERLGCGGQAEVWLARDQMLDRFVTVKKVPSFEIRKGGADDERLNSLRTRAEIEHPAIPTLFGIIPNGDEFWLIGEYVEGVALSELLGELSPESIYAVAKDLLSALRGLERLSLVHGDLSPNNIVIDRNGLVRLLDFESCSRIGETLSSTSTIGFSAPERHSRKVGLPTVDTWSVGAILIWLVTQRTPEVVLDDAKKPISVAIGPALPATDLLGDVINIAAAATRLDSSLRPLVADLEERLSLSYRWLEPVNRSALQILVRSRLRSTREPDEGSQPRLRSPVSSNEKPESKLGSVSTVHPDHGGSRREDRQSPRRVNGHDALREQVSAGCSGTDCGSTREVSAMLWGEQHKDEERLGIRGPGEKSRVETSIKSCVSSVLKGRSFDYEQRGLGKPSRRGWFSNVQLFSSGLSRLLLLSIGLSIFMGVYSPLLNLGQKSYSVRVDVTRLSPATPLPKEFSPQWLASIFSGATPDSWEHISSAELIQSTSPANPERGGDRAGSELFVRGGRDGREASDELTKIGKVLNAQAASEVNYEEHAAIEIILSINCAQGICELLVEREEGGRSALDHTVILDTGNVRIWHAAIAGLAKSLAAE